VSKYATLVEGERRSSQVEALGLFLPTHEVCTVVEMQ